MAKKDDLTPKQAEEIIKKFCEPPYNAEEIRLKEDVRLVLKGEGKGYEGDDDEEEEEGDSPQNNEPKGGAGESAAQGAASQATQSQGSSVIENVQQYAGEVIANIQSLGTAGSVALSSATYFQAETVVESSHDIVAIVEEVEEDYDMTLQNYFVETTATFIDDASIRIPIVKKAADALYEVSDNMETKAERVEKQEIKAEQKAAEKEAKQAEKAEAEAKKEAAREQAKEERKAEREAKKAERQAEKEAEAKETTKVEEEAREEQKSEEKSEAKSEEKSEPKAEEKSEQKSEEQKSEQKSEEPKQEPKAEEPKSEPKPEPQAEEPKPEAKAEEVKLEPKAEEPIPETPVDNEIIDETKPHSDVESDDSGSIIDDFPKVETPFMDDSTIRPVSPVSSNTRPTSPTI